MTSANLGDAPSLSPFLFLSLLLLNYNMVFTLVGVVQNIEGSIVSEVAQGKRTTAYIVSLVLFPTVCGMSVFFKYCSLCCSLKRTRRWCRKVVGSLLYDVTFVTMGTLYLAGDNLPIFICSGRDNMKAREACRGRSSYILGVSLLLHAALHLASTIKLGSTEMPVFPVTGRIRKAYQSALQLAALTIFVDQTFSTAERFVTHLDIEAVETPNCGCVGNTTATNCLSLINREVGGFFAGLFTIIMFIVLGLVMKNWRDYCSCCWIERKLEMCQHLWENLFIFILHALVIIFMVLYTVADNRWLWTCVELPDPTTGRLLMLIAALVLSLVCLGMYFFIIFLPGVGTVLENKKFLSRYEYAILEARMVDSEWVQSVHAQPATVAPPTGHEVSLQTFTEYSDSKSQRNLTESSGDFTVDESYGSASVSLPFEDDATCRNGLVYIFKRFCDFRVCCKCDCFRRCMTGSQSEEGITCWGWVKNKCKRDKSSAREEDEEMIMLTYLGNKKNVSTVTLSSDKTLQMIEAAQTYPAGTQFYLVLKAIPSQETKASNSSAETADRLENEAGRQRGLKECESQEQVDSLNTPQKGESCETPPTTPYTLISRSLVSQPRKPRKAVVSESDVIPLVEAEQ